MTKYPYTLLKAEDGGPLGDTSFLEDPDIDRRIATVLDFLSDNGIPFTLYRHPPLPTVEEALKYWGQIPSTHCKNLFLRNHKGNRHYLVTFECHKTLPIHALEHKIREGKLSFASPERMERCLGLRPGSVSPLGLVNDIGISSTASPKELFENGHRVKFFYDSDLLKAQKVSFHPCDNTAGVVLSGEDFLRFLTLWGGEWEALDTSIQE